MHLNMRRMRKSLIDLVGPGSGCLTVFWYQLGTKLSLTFCLTELGKVVEHGRRVPLTTCQHGSKRKMKPDSVPRSHRMEAAVVHWTGDL
jgi:hypothetical protein